MIDPAAKRSRKRIRRLITPDSPPLTRTECGRMGAAARNASLTPRERTLNASRAAKARWRKRDLPPWNGPIIPSVSAHCTGAIVYGPRSHDKCEGTVDGNRCVCNCHTS